MSLTEKTLELNVTHELLVLGQGIATVFWGGATSVTAPPRPGPPIYAAGLTLREEALHGWDVSIEVPTGGATPARVAFLQFKLGERRRWSNHPLSRFRSGPGRAHVVFGINNNSHRNQHSRLRATAALLGAPNAAIYALPLLTEAEHVAEHVGDLMARTAFVTVPSVDRAAVPPIVDGTERKIAVSLSNLAIREVRSVPHAFHEEDVGARLLGQIAAVRLQREMAAWRTPFLKTRTQAVRPSGRRLAFRLVRYLAYFCGVPARPALALFGLEVDGRSSVRGAGGQGGRRGPRTEALAAMRWTRLETIAKHVGPLLDAIVTESWPAAVPELDGMDLLVEVQGPVSTILPRGPQDGPGSARLPYMVI